MRHPFPRSSGRADPLGLLVLAVMLALTVTIGMQAQARLGGDSPRLAVCNAPCLTAEVQR